MTDASIARPASRLAPAAPPPGSRATCVVDVHVLLTRGERVLLLRRSSDAPYAASLFTAPSGHVEPGERVLAAAVREVREETGVELTEAMLRLGHVTQHRGPGGVPRIGWFFVATGWPGARRPDRHQEPFNAEPHKHSELIWASLDDLPVDCVAYVRDAIAALRAGHLASEHFQADGDAVAHDPSRPSVLRPIPVPDTAGTDMRRALGVVAPPRIGAPWTWHGGAPVPDALAVRQSLGWLFDPAGRVLLVVDADGTVTLPGGGVEPNDRDAYATLVREADEEAAVRLGSRPGLWLGYLFDADGVIYGHEPCARARFAARIEAVGPARPDPATGTTWGRLLVPPRMAATLLGWDDGLAEALAAQDAACAAWGLPRNESWDAEWLPEAGADFTGRTDAGFADRAARVARMPRVAAYAAVLSRNALGQVLFVEPTYREDAALLLPGGMVEADGESPREAARREVEEELGVALPVGRILATDWTTGPDRPPLAVTVFDGGVLTQEQIAALAPGRDGEVARVVWADPRLGGITVPPPAARRIEAALLAAEIGAAALELVDGRITGTVCASSGKPPTPTARRKVLAARLAAAGHLPDSRWRKAVARFPREEFLPGLWAPRALPRPAGAVSGAVREGGWMHLDGARQKGRAEWAWRVDAGGPVTIAVDQAQRVEPGGRLFTGTVRVPSAGLPRYLTALHALELPADPRVLVLGVGAGLGAGLIHTYLNQHARTAPRMCGVEIDPGLAEATRERLERVGMRIPVLVADALAPDLADHSELAAALGALDTAGSGSVDRLVADFPVDHLPAGWLRLLAPGGRLAAFLAAGAQVPPALLVLDAFAERTGATGTLTPLPTDTAAAPGLAAPGQPMGCPSGCAVGATVLRGTGTGPRALYDPGFLIALAHLAPTLSWTDGEPVQVHDSTTGATAVLQRHADRWSTRTRGAYADPWARVETVHRLWEQAGRPQEYRVDADPDGTLRIYADDSPLAWTVPAPTVEGRSHVTGGRR